MTEERSPLLKIFICCLLVLQTCSLFAEEKKTSFKFYGFVRNDFFYNSRQNEQSVDGVFNIIPRPVLKDEHGKDKNAESEAEMLSICSRLGLDVRGMNMMGAQTFAKIEADFAGSGSTYFMLRLRQAYFKMNWTKSELLIGQTWHPLSGNVMPNIISLNTGAPFQPFNRSPQLRYTYKLNDVFSVSAAALYQMQYTSQGPNGASSSYMKRAILPDFFIGIESRTEHWQNGIGFDAKTLKPSQATITSLSAMAYTQYVNPKFQFRLKGIWGQNMSDHLMINGYGVRKLEEESGVVSELDYVNFNVFTSWLNIVYGQKWRVGMFAGFSQNLGTDKDLAQTQSGNYIVYSRGFYKDEQLYADCVVRGGAFLSYNLSKLSFGLEYNFTTAEYGKIQSNGRTKENTWAPNHRISANAIYTF